MHNQHGAQNERRSPTNIYGRSPSSRRGSHNPITRQTKDPMKCDPVTSQSRSVTVTTSGTSGNSGPGSTNRLSISPFIEANRTSASPGPLPAHTVSETRRSQQSKASREPYPQVTELFQSFSRSSRCSFPEKSIQFCRSNETQYPTPGENRSSPITFVCAFTIMTGTTSGRANPSTAISLATVGAIYHQNPSETTTPQHPD